MLALIPLRAWLIGVAFAVVLIGFGIFVKHQRDIGAEKAREEIHQQAERDRAEAIAGARDVRACRDVDGVWSLVSGTCIKP